MSNSESVLPEGEGPEPEGETSGGVTSGGVTSGGGSPKGSGSSGDSGVTAAPLPFGEWPSPITAELIAAGGVGLGGAVARDHQRWWSELRPAERGRVVLVRHDTHDGSTADVLPAPWSARTRVHEYGGGAWSLGATAVYFSNWDDQRLYRLEEGSSAPVALTALPPVAHGWRYADGVETPDGAWFVCVRENHMVQTDSGELLECVNEIVAIATDGSERVVVLVSDSDFVAAPRVSNDGKRLSWFQWNHPNMPWDSTELCAGELSDNGSILELGRVMSIAGNSDAGTEGSAVQGLEAGGLEADVSRPEEAVHGSNWLSSGELVFATDRSGFWNLHRWNPDTGIDHALTNLVDAEIGMPQWVFGVQRWVEIGPDQLGIVITEAASDSLALLDIGGSVPSVPQPLDLQYVMVSSLGRTSSGSLLAMVGSSDQLHSLVEVDPISHDVAVLRPAENLGIDQRWFSTAERFDFESAEGRQSHAFYYPPTGLGVAGPEDALPPLVVMGHGGPTAHSSPDLSLKIQFWTSRGIAVVDVNYGGSTGYGREYRRLLNGAWGIVDVEDCVAAAEQLASAGRVDRDRMAIRGGSAGGFTVLRALEVSDAFSAGTSLYGVADLGALAADTHKFESRYLDGMIGPYPEDKAIYDERSPINHTEDLSCPLLVMQGSEDEVVPPSQSEAIVAAVSAKGLAHAYLLFEGEQHGFRQAETIVRSLEAELWFYGKVFGFRHADPIADIPGAVGFS